MTATEDRKEGDARGHGCGARVLQGTRKGPEGGPRTQSQRGAALQALGPGAQGPATCKDGSAGLKPHSRVGGRSDIRGADRSCKWCVDQARRALAGKHTICLMLHRGHAASGIGGAGRAAGAPLGPRAHTEARAVRGVDSRSQSGGKSRGKSAGGRREEDIPRGMNSRGLLPVLSLSYCFSSGGPPWATCAGPRQGPGLGKN